jgi:septal ring factor EnvC (AmiA/AmiB activator)
MNDPLLSLSLLLTDAILPNLKSVQANQAEQIAASDRLEQAIEELRSYIQPQFAQLSAQITSLRAELAATQAALKAAQVQSGLRVRDRSSFVH